MENIITQVSPAVNLQFVTAPKVAKVGNNVWTVDRDYTVIGGPTAPNGYLFCQVCEDATCEHAEAVHNAWLRGDISQEQYIPFDGEPMPVITEVRRDYAL